MYENQMFNGLVAVLGGFFVFFLLIVIAVLVFQIIVSVKVYKKAGKAGWEAIVPFYSDWVLCEVASVKWWCFLIMNAAIIVSMLGLVVLEPLAGLVGIAARFTVNYNVAIKFGKDPIGYGIGLTLLPVVFYGILAFGDATYSDAEVSSYGVIPEEKVEEAKNKHNQNTTTNNTTSKSTTKKSTTKSKTKFCKNCGAELNGGKFCSSCGAENTQK